MFLIISCNSDDKEANETLANIDVATGMYLRGSKTTEPIRLGNPNNFSSKILIYPNPFQSVITLQSGTPTDLWVVPVRAEKINQTIDYTSVLNANSFTENTVENKAILKLDLRKEEKETAEEIPTNEEKENPFSVADFNPNGFTSENDLDFSELKSGSFYKVFVKIEGKLYWDIIYKSGQENDLKVFEDLWGI